MYHNYLLFSFWCVLSSLLFVYCFPSCSVPISKKYLSEDLDLYGECGNTVNLVDTAFLVIVAANNWDNVYNLYHIILMWDQEMKDVLFLTEVTVWSNVGSSSVFWWGLFMVFWWVLFDFVSPDGRLFWFFWMQWT